MVIVSMGKRTAVYALPREKRECILENSAVVEGGHEGVSCAGGFVGLRAGDEE